MRVWKLYNKRPAKPARVSAPENFFPDQMFVKHMLFSLYTIHSIVYSILYSIHCILYTTYCILNNSHEDVMLRLVLLHGFVLGLCLVGVSRRSWDTVVDLGEVDEGRALDDREPDVGTCH